MITVTQHVARIVERSPLLAEILGEGLGNIAAIARQIRPEIEATRLEPVSVPTVAMALRRLSQKRPAPVSGLKLLAQVRSIGVKSNIIECVLDQLRPAELKVLLTTLPFNDAHQFVHLSRGLFETIIVSDETLESTIQSALSERTHPAIIRNLASLTLRLPAETISTPGVYYPVLKALAWEGISFVEVISVGSELSILFHDRDIDHAFTIVKRVTSRAPNSSPKGKSGSVTA